MTEEFKTISCKFDNTERVYSYKCKTTIDVKVGDRVIVNTPKNGPTEVTVMTVSDTPPDESKFPIKEIMSVVNPAHEV